MFEPINFPACCFPIVPYPFPISSFQSFSFDSMVLSWVIFMKFCLPQDDKNIAHLTHVSEMEKKCESLARITTILKDVIQNKVM